VHFRRSIPMSCGTLQERKRKCAKGAAKDSFACSDQRLFDGDVLKVLRVEGRHVVPCRIESLRDSAANRSWLVLADGMPLT